MSKIVSVVKIIKNCQKIKLYKVSVFSYFAWSVWKNKYADILMFENYFGDEKTRGIVLDADSVVLQFAS